MSRPYWINAFPASRVACPTEASQSGRRPAPPLWHHHTEKLDALVADLEPFSPVTRFVISQISRMFLSHGHSCSFILFEEPSRGPPPLGHRHL